MLIYESGYSQQEVTLEGYSASIEAQIVSVNDSALNIESEGVEYELEYKYDGTSLITYLEDVPSYPYDEVDYWMKVSDEPPDQQIETLGVSNYDFQNEIEFA